MLIKIKTKSKERENKERMRERERKKSHLLMMKNEMNEWISFFFHYTWAKKYSIFFILNEIKFHNFFIIKIFWFVKSFRNFVISK